MNFIDSIVVFALLSLASIAQGQNMLTDGELADLVESEWRRLKSQPPADKSVPGFAWAYRFTPAFPLVWPPTSRGGVVYYGVPYGLAAGRVSDGEYVGEAWVKVEVVSGGSARVSVLSKKIQTLGIQGVHPLGADEIRVEREHAQGPEHLAALTRLPLAGDPRTPQIRSYYCSWARHQALFAKYLATAYQSDFFSWLACPSKMGS